jgi:hypothetical protein
VHSNEHAPCLSACDSIMRQSDWLPLLLPHMSSHSTRVAILWHWCQPSMSACGGGGCGPVVQVYPQVLPQRVVSWAVRHWCCRDGPAPWTERLLLVKYVQWPCLHRLLPWRHGLLPEQQLSCCWAYCHAHCRRRTACRCGCRRTADRTDQVTAAWT